MHQPLDTGRAAGGGDVPGPVDMDGLVALPSALERNARRVDHGLAARHGGGDRSWHPDVGAHQHHLADVARRGDRIGKVGASHRDADLIALARERLHDDTADETAAAEDGDLLYAHGLLPIAEHRWLAKGAAAALRLTSAVGRPNSRPALARMPCPGGGIGRRTSFR